MKSWYSLGRFHGPLIAGKIDRAALSVFAETFEWHQDTNRPFGRIEPVLISQPSFSNSSALVRISRFCAL